jgi:glycosyltransferase involved in cell wall biosynthesis
MLTELVRHWPAGYRMELFAVPPRWQPPAGSVCDVAVRTRQSGGRVRAIAAATVALRRAGGERVLSLSPSLAIAGCRAPVTTVVHDLAFRLWPHGLGPAVRRYRRVSYATAIRRSSLLVCVSARTQHDLLGVYGVPGARTRVWHPGSDLDVIPGRLPDEVVALRQHGQRYLAIAGHAPHKGVELAIEAVARDRRYALVVLTGGQRVAGFTHAAAASPAADRILFLDRLSDADYAAVLAGAAAFLMPSHFEGYGLPAVEALRLGIPTVVSPDPALVEATGGAAIRMDSWTGAALARALSRIDQPRDGVAPVRSWREATAQLCALLHHEPDAVAVSGQG